LAKCGIVFNYQEVGHKSVLVFRIESIYVKIPQESRFIFNFILKDSLKRRIETKKKNRFSTILFSNIWGYFSK